VPDKDWGVNLRNLIKAWTQNLNNAAPPKISKKSRNSAITARFRNTEDGDGLY
jgi:hypothetical protein